MLHEIVEGFYAEPELVAVVKETGEKECAVFTVGQSAVDGGFRLEYPAGEVAQAVNDLREEDEDEQDDDEEEDEDEDD